ncbi:hypothetical protein [Robiginitalea sp. SC105]|uniref:hypothetical protein n=1 Tax=Robiginitalea sp. SC105 TaxID=2762332 RepID=UPI001639ACB1|nr:hypothetical protein [Robiginitalea sp. SC105]MBC2838241.1 hypothetical protein [Robiginitalea sp. SC105]
MRIYITLDYELFFGPRTGTPEHCMLRPTDELIRLAAPLGIRFTCFVDSGYLLALRRQQSEFPILGEHLAMVSSQLRELVVKGHGVELHIHPHWEDTYFDGQVWNTDTSRYRLANFSEEEIRDIVGRYSDVLKEITRRQPVAYRAGGWSAQPFPPIGRALGRQGIFTDSSVYPGGHYQSENQAFDFRDVPPFKTEYRFSEDLTQEDPAGPFTEIPISAQRVSPIFYWKFAWTKINRLSRHQPFGNGKAIILSREGMFRSLTRPTVSVVSMDGYRSGLLKKALRTYQKKTGNRGNFVIIGHPKAFTPYSLHTVKKFMEETSTIHQYSTFQ